MLHRFLHYLLISVCCSTSLGSYAEAPAGQSPDSQTSSHLFDSEQLGELLTQSPQHSRKRPSQITVNRGAITQAPSNIKYQLKWQRYAAASAWSIQFQLDEKAFREAVNAAILKGLWLVDIAVTQTSQGLSFAGVWHENKRKRSQIVRSNISQANFAELNILNQDKGFKLLRHTLVDTMAGARVSAIWVEDSIERTRYKNRTALDALLTHYLSQNKIAGVSLSISKNGTAIYTRGHGFAHKEQGQRAHANTVYSLGAVSQAVSGVLALRLEEQGQLRDGVPINFSLSWPTAYLLLGIPTHHAHTLEQLFAHSACLDNIQERALAANFRESNGLLSSRRYLKAIWHRPLRKDCELGRTASYSLQGYVFAAAVIEMATGKSVYSLFRNELYLPFGLQSFGFRGVQQQRAACAGSLRSCYAQSYRFDGQPIDQAVDLQPLAEGMEGSVIALQTFVELLHGNDILSSKARDKRLWSSFSPHSRYGLGWQVAAGGVVQQSSDTHRGSVRLIVNRKNKYSIALLSNQQSPSEVLDKLVTDIQRLL